jgi:hypothetical protein
MRLTTLALIGAIALFALASCNAQPTADTGANVGETAVETGAGQGSQAGQESAPGTAPSLTSETLANAEYVLPDGSTVQLTDGVYQEKPDETASTFITNVSLLDDLTAYGDLNGDGVEDAAVIIVDAPGGSGVFTYLAAVVDEDGSPANVDTVDLGDRTDITTVAVEDGAIRVDVVAHGPDDPMCCPTEKRIWTYELQEGQLTQIADELVGTVEPEEASQAPEGEAGATSLVAGLVSVDPAALPEGESVSCEVRPATSADDESLRAYAALPEHILCTWEGDQVDEAASPFFAQRQILVLPMEPYVSLYAGSDLPAVEQQHALMMMLNIEKPENPSAPLPMLPPHGSESQVIGVQTQPLEFNGGSGYRYLAHYADEGAPVTSDSLIYSFQGLTSDGAYWVSLVYPVSIDILAADASEVGENILATIEADTDAYYSGMAQAIASLDPESDISPALSQLDEIVTGLTVGQQGQQ